MMTGTPPTSCVSAGYITKYGSNISTSSPGLTSDHIASDKAPLVPSVTKTLRSACPYCLSIFACSFSRKRRNSLRQRVGVLPRLDGFDAGCFHFLRHIEIRLPDRKIDRILHLRRQVEDFADAAGIKGFRAVGEEGHGEAPG